MNCNTLAWGSVEHRNDGHIELRAHCRADCLPDVSQYVYVKIIPAAKVVTVESGPFGTQNPDITTIPWSNVDEDSPTIGELIGAAEAVARTHWRTMQSGEPIRKI